MWVKICGITQAEDATAASQAGADAVGLNFVGGPRRVHPSLARTILDVLPPFVTPVALVALEAGRIEEGLYQWLIEAPVRHLQVYGATDAKELQTLVQDGFSVFPVVHVRGATLCDPMTEAVVRAGSAVVLDAYDPQQKGGTGKAFCWDWVAKARDDGCLEAWPPIILAGGLRPENVVDAIRVVAPYGVDVSSGVEIDGKPGHKDSAKLVRFIAASRAASE